MPWKIPIGNMIAPAMRKPHKPSAKQVKMCVNHANKKVKPIMVKNII